MDIIKLFVSLLVDGWTRFQPDVQTQQHIVNTPYAVYWVTKYRGVVWAERDGKVEVVYSTRWIHASEKVFENLLAWTRKTRGYIEKAREIYNAQKPKKQVRVSKCHNEIFGLAYELGFLPENQRLRPYQADAGFFLAKHGDNIIAEALAQGLIDEGEAKRLRHELVAEVEYHFTGKPYWQPDSTKEWRRLQHRRARRAVKQALAHGDWERAEVAGEDILREYLD